MMRRRPSAGFALISTLVVLTAVVIMITAFVSTMRTERIAAHHYSEQKQAQALAQSVLSRLLAEHAAPVIDGTPLKPYEVDATTKLPTPETTAAYLNDDPERMRGIFRMEPQDGLSIENHLVRISRAPAGGEQAYSPEDWAYLRQQDPVFWPKDAQGHPVAPEWLDYYPVLPDGSTATVPSGQVAFAIWEEAGKLDVNMAGEDPGINGMAPHDLEIERFAEAQSASLLARLDAGDGERQRSNFSLRRISGDSAVDNTGDDRRIFSIEELIRENLVSPANALRLTAYSRDFDVRPEWDSNRAHASAKAFLRSYVNNPDLYRLMSGAAAGQAGPALVRDTMSEQALRNTLSSHGFDSGDASWMQIMRLLAALRLSLPPFQSHPAPPDPTQPVALNEWTNEDIWGIALNIVQASDPPSDQNLVARDSTVPAANQPNTRTGVRISPYITEVAFKIESAGSPGHVNVTEYIEIWNPYSFSLAHLDYLVGETSGMNWPHAGFSLYTQGQLALNHRVQQGPVAGGFEVVALPTRSNMNLSQQGTTGQDPPGSPNFGFRVRASPYMTNRQYYGASAPWSHACVRGPAYSASGFELGMPYHLTVWIPAARIPAPGDPPVWYSFQIDDPRMSSFTRYSPNWKRSWTNDDTGDQPGAADERWRYTWQGYFNQHSLAGITEGPKVTSGFGDGYNINFGENWPASWKADPKGFQRALATFALPGRPFRNVGELGTVFANRPWRTLSFAATTAPEDSTLAAGSQPQHAPTTLLDYLTTVGTTTLNGDLNYKYPDVVSTAFVEANLRRRAQDNRWLFESVDTNGQPAGPLRPIRGRINLNTASQEALAALLEAPYTMVNSLGLQTWPGLGATAAGQDLSVTIDPADAEVIAAAITDPAAGVRPLRALADLKRLDLACRGKGLNLYAKYPDSVVDAILGRLAQFGTIRQQIYTVDILARTFNPQAEARGRRVVTAEVRMLARVYFDTFSRKAFVESTEYR